MDVGSIRNDAVLGTIADMANTSAMDLSGTVDLANPSGVEIPQLGDLGTGTTEPVQTASAAPAENTGDNLGLPSEPGAMYA